MASGKPNIKDLTIRWFALVCLLLPAYTSQAQTDTLDASDVIYKNAHHFIPTFSIQVLPRGILYAQQGDFEALSIKSRYNMAIDYGFDYNYSINKMFAVGIGYRVKYFSYHFRISSPDVLPEYGGYKVSRFSMYNITFDVPLQFVFRYPFKNKYAFRLVSGPAFRFVMHIDDNTLYRIGEQQELNMAFNPTNIQNAWMADAHIAFGFEMQTKKHHVFFLQSGVNFSLFRRVVGNYQLTNGEDVIQQGMYRQNLSHMELRMGYVFTGARKKLRKAGLLPPSKFKIHWGK